MMMARLCDIVKEGVLCKVQYREDNPVQWLGYGLDDHDLYSHEDLLLSDDWKEVTPTVADVLRERGYREKVDPKQEMAAYSRDQKYQTPTVFCPKVTSPAEATRICDFLDSLGAGK